LAGLVDPAAVTRFSNRSGPNPLLPSGFFLKKKHLEQRRKGQKNGKTPFPRDSFGFFLPGKRLGPLSRRTLKNSNQWSVISSQFFVRKLRTLIR